MLFGVVLCLAVLAPATIAVDEKRLSGVVRDGIGAPVAGATVTVTSEAASVVRVAVTDAAGRFTLVDFDERGVLQVVVEHRDYRVTRIDVEVDETRGPLTLVLDSADGR